MAKKYRSVDAFLRAAKKGGFKGVVVVDNDCVHAYVNHDMVFDFGGAGPEGALIDVLVALGIKAEYA